MDTKLVAGIGGIVLVVCLYLAGLAGVTFIGYLVVLALQKYIGG